MYTVMDIGTVTPHTNIIIKNIIYTTCALYGCLFIMSYLPAIKNRTNMIE